MQLIRLTFFSFLVFSVLSCKKKGDESAPIITSFSCNKQAYVEGDTIWVNAQVSDETKLHSAAVSLSYRINSEEKIVDRIGIQVSGQQSSISVGIPLNYIELVSGEHELQLQVSDGENTSNEFISISIALKPKVYQGLFLPVKNGSKFDIHFLTANGNDSLFKSLTTGSLYGMCNNRLHQLVLANGTSNLLSGFDIETGNMLWTSSASSVSTPDLNGFYHSLVDDRYYISLASGYIKALATNGSTLMASAKIGGGRVPKQVTVTGKFVVVYSESLNGADRKLELLNRGSGGYYITLPQADEVTALAYIEKERFVAFTTSGNATKVTLYDNDAETEITSTISGVTGITKAETISATAILCLTDQGLCVINPSTGSYSFITNSYSPTLNYYAPSSQVYYWNSGSIFRQTIGSSEAESQGFVNEPAAIWPYWK